MMKSVKEKKYRNITKWEVFMVENCNLNSGGRVNINQTEKKKNQCVIVSLVMNKYSKFIYPLL